MPETIVPAGRVPALSDLEIVSHGRRGPGERLHLTPSQVEQIARTVRRTPEVIVKVSGGARDAGGAKAHVDYIDRHGRLGIETDEGYELGGKGAGAALVDDWNLDLSKGQYRPRPAPGERDPRPKVVHHLVLSMPGRTPPDAVLAAARRFARESFALQHRYAMVLHTDQAHPHVHLVVKAEHEFEPARRLHIRKATLRQWRELFARCLREQGVAANATPGPVRGRTRGPMKDPIHQRLKALAQFDALSPAQQAWRRPPQASTFVRAKVEAVARALQAGRLAPDPGRATLEATRDAVQRGWQATAAALRAQGDEALAREVEAFAAAMPPVRTDQERIAAGLRAQVRGLRRSAPAAEVAAEPRGDGGTPRRGQGTDR